MYLISPVYPGAPVILNEHDHRIFTLVSHTESMLNDKGQLRCLFRCFLRPQQTFIWENGKFSPTPDATPELPTVKLLPQCINIRLLHEQCPAYLSTPGPNNAKYLYWSESLKTGDLVLISDGYTMYADILTEMTNQGHTRTARGMRTPPIVWNDRGFEHRWHDADSGAIVHLLPALNTRLEHLFRTQ